MSRKNHDNSSISFLDLQIAHQALQKSHVSLEQNFQKLKQEYTQLAEASQELAGGNIVREEHVNPVELQLKSEIAALQTELSVQYHFMRENSTSDELSA